MISGLQNHLCLRGSRGSLFVGEVLAASISAFNYETTVGGIGIVRCPRRAQNRRITSKMAKLGNSTTLKKRGERLSQRY